MTLKISKQYYMYNTTGYLILLQINTCDDGKIIISSGIGNGQINDFYKSINKLKDINNNLILYDKLQLMEVIESNPQKLHEYIERKLKNI